MLDYGSMNERLWEKKARVVNVLIRLRLNHRKLDAALFSAPDD